MKVMIACVGKLKESYYTMAEKEYLKRLSRFANVAVVEIAEEKMTGNAMK